jgi:TorA maturation chaperone TorD
MNEQKIEEIGMRLANRIYIYRVFHIIFGTTPTGDELKTLSADETLQVFATVKSVDELASLYELMTTFGEHVEDAAYIESLKTEYSRLFLVPGTSSVHPWESPYIGKQSMLFQESTLDVRHRFLEYGYEAQMQGNFPDDHLSLMLDFLAHLSGRAFDAFGDNEDAALWQILISQEDFIKTHLLNWLPLFCEKLKEKDKSTIFLRSGEALRKFLELDAQFINEMLQDRESFM